MWIPLDKTPLITICTPLHPSSLLQVNYCPYAITDVCICTCVHCYFYPLCLFYGSLSVQKKSLLKEPYWNKNVFTSHKVRSFLDSQFTTSPYYIFAKHHFKTADFPFYTHSSVLLCFLTLRITLALFREAKPAVWIPLLKSDLWRSWYYNSSAFSSFSQNSCFCWWSPCIYTLGSSGSCSVHFLVDGSQFLELAS